MTSDPMAFIAAEISLIGFTTALGAGLLIGIERERRKGTGPYRAFAGVRTFALTALTGAGASASAQPLLIVVGGALIAIVAATAYFRDRSDDPGVTTEVALYVTYLIGVIAMHRPELAAAGAVVVTILLVSRGWLHRFAVDVLSAAELRDGLVLCASALVILPLLPESLGPWLPGVSPHHLWRLVVVFMGLQAAGYVALRAAGPGLGLALSGLVSGFVSSTATIAALGARARKESGVGAACVTGALFSNVATVVLLGVVTATVHVQAFMWIAPSLVAGLLAALIGAGLSWHYQSKTVTAEIMQGRAFNLMQAVGFAALLSGVTGVVALANHHFGTLAAPLSAALAGFFDVHAAAASVLVLAAGDALGKREMVFALLIAVSTNSLSKLVAAFSMGGMAYGVRVTGGLLLVAGATWMPVVWSRF